MRNRRDVMAVASLRLWGKKLLDAQSTSGSPSGGLIEAVKKATGGGQSSHSTVDVGAERGSTTTTGASQIGLGILGDYVYLTPTKLGGGAHAQDLQSGKTLAWIEYWNYGDSCPIAHHLAAYPSSDPRKGFEFVNSTQGGDNVLIYSLPTEIKSRLAQPDLGPGRSSHALHYDGSK